MVISIWQGKGPFVTNIFSFWPRRYNSVRNFANIKPKFLSPRVPLLPSSSLLLIFPPHAAIHSPPLSYSWSKFYIWRRNTNSITNFSNIKPKFLSPITPLLPSSSLLLIFPPRTVIHSPPLLFFSFSFHARETLEGLPCRCHFRPTSTMLRSSPPSTIAM